MPTLDSAPVVGAGGGLYVAAADTAPPVDFDDLDSSPWKYLGLIDEDGVSYMPLEEETEDMNVWQLSFPWDVVTTGQSSTLSANLAQWNKDVISFVFAGGTWAGGVTGSPHTFTPPGLGETSNNAVFLLVETSSGHKIGVYYRRAKVTEREEATFSKSEMATLGVTITMLGTEGAVPQVLFFDDTSFTGGVTREGEDETTTEFTDEQTGKTEDTRQDEQSEQVPA